MLIPYFYVFSYLLLVFSSFSLVALHLACFVDDFLLYVSVTPDMLNRIRWIEIIIFDGFGSNKPELFC